MKRKIALMMSSVLLARRYLEDVLLMMLLIRHLQLLMMEILKKLKKFTQIKSKKIVRKKIVLNNCWVTTLNRFCFSITMKK